MDVRTPAGGLAGRVRMNAVRAAHDPEQRALRQHLPATHAGPLGNVSGSLGFARHRQSVPAGLSLFESAVAPLMAVADDHLTRQRVVFHQTRRLLALLLLAVSDRQVGIVLLFVFLFDGLHHQFLGDGFEGLLQGGAIRRRLFRQPLVVFIAHVDRDELLALKELAESGKVTPFIDRSYPLAEAPAALAYLETTRAQGKVVITI